MLSIKEYRSSKDFKMLVQKMFEARHVSHVLHLNSNSYAEHEALKEFYEGILGFLDDLIETHQGQYGLIGHIPLSVESFPDSLEYLEDCCKFFKFGRESIKEPHLQNIMDEIISLTNKTLYKIKFLK
jgi:hypothetical protein